MTTREPAPHSKPFQPEMPQIPGVNDPQTTRRSAIPGLVWLPTLLGVAALALVVGGAWWMLHRSRPDTKAPSPLAGSSTLTPAAPPRMLTAAVRPRGPQAVATTRELARPWSSKKFTFYKPDSGVGIPAMIVRLPGVDRNRSSAYWAFSLNAPYELCQLTYITDLGKLANRFDYHASHPMVASTCSRTVYDPLQIGTAPDGAWVRGDVVEGSGIRPPFEIEIRVRGGSIIADKIEQ